MSKIDVQMSDEFDFTPGDIRKVIIPKMDQQVLNSAGYRALLDVIDLLQPGAKEEFIKYNEKRKGSIH